MTFGLCELMQDVKVTPVIKHPCDAASVWKRHLTTSVFSSNSGPSVQITVAPDN
jgi:hypothetical protein